ncbi:MAG: XdhC family protein [Thermoplasmatota archaeon]
MRDLYEEAIRLMDARVPFTLCTVVRTIGSVPAREGAKMIVRADGTTLGTVGGAGLEERAKDIALAGIARRRGGIERFDLANWKEGGLNSVCGGTVEIAFDVHPARPHLLLAGGGHVARAIAEACRPLGWNVTAVDDREEYVSADRFPDARSRVVSGPTWFSEADLSSYSHAFVLGYSHEIDTTILEHLLRRFPGTIALIGSEAKRRSMFTRLASRGLAAERIEAIESPIGLAIGAETPAEIAVAVVARIIAQEHGRDPTTAELQGRSAADRVVLPRAEAPTAAPANSDGRPARRPAERAHSPHRHGDST